MTPAQQAEITPLRSSSHQRSFISTHTSLLRLYILLERAKTWVSKVRVRGTKPMLIAQ